MIENIKVREYNENKFPSVNISLTGAFLSDAVSDLIKPLSALETLITQFVKGIKKICAILGIMSELFTNFSAYDTDYNVTIEEQYFNNLPSKTNAGLTKSGSDNEDRNKAEEILNDSQDVADKIGFDIDSMSVGTRWNTAYNIIEADMEKITNDFSEICEYQSILRSVAENLKKRLKLL